MSYKRQFDFGGIKNLPQLDTTGKMASHLDNQLGLPYELLDDLSIREQRVIVMKKLAELREIEIYERS